MYQKRVTQVNINVLDEETEVLVMVNREMVEILNNYFVLVFTVEDTKYIPLIRDHLQTY